MRKQIDIEELARYLHNLLDCDIVEIFEHGTLFFPNSTLVYCHDADKPRDQSFILPVSVVASDPKYYKWNQIEYVFDFTKTEKIGENRKRIVAFA